MKWIRILLIAAALFQATPVHAQRFGDGRFLRRLIGVEESPQDLERQRIEALQKARKQQEAAQTQRQDAQGLQQRSAPTPAVPQRSPYPGSRSPTPATRQSAPTRYGYRPFSTPGSKPQPSSALEPTPAKQSDTRSSSTSARLGASATTGLPNYPQTRFPPPRRPKATPAYGESESGKAIAKSQNRKQSGTIKGFGFTLRMKSGKAVVSHVEKGSTADDAGLKTGDRIDSIGSLAIESIGDAEQFTDVLKPGDQLEFEFERRGKKQKILVPFVRSATEVADAASEGEGSKLMLEPYSPKTRSAAVSAPLPIQSATSSPARSSSFVDSAQRHSLPPPKTKQSADSSNRRDSLRTDRPSEVDQLRDIVQTQKQVIAQLQKRLEQLEKSSRSGPLLYPPQ